MTAIGATVWRFDSNYRRYAADNRSALIYREHWRPMKVIGETSRSWLVEHGREPLKIPKRGDRKGWAFSQEEVDAACWDHEHRYKVVRLVENCRPALLRQVAELIGYTFSDVTKEKAQ